MYDILIQNASVMDGTGRPAYHADVAVKDGKIVLHPQADSAAEVIDAAGLVLCPGFIDSHSHGDRILGTAAGQLCKTNQGITTELAGQCGMTTYPVSPDPEKREMHRLALGVMEVPEAFDTFTDLEHYLRWAEQQPLTCNFKLYVGHRALRIAAMGFDARKPTDTELAQMQSMLREAMEHGAMGLTSGLIYPPGSYAEEAELVELCRIVAKYDGIYATHMRNEAEGVVEAVREAISVAERAGCRLNVSHHKVCGRENWGLSVQTLKLIHEAIDRGVRITMDVYPYTASSTNLNVCLLAAFFAHGPEKMAQLLADPSVRASLKEEMTGKNGRWHNCGGWSGIMVTCAPETRGAEGKTIEAYAKQIGKDPFEAYFDLILHNGHGAQAIYFFMGEEDLLRIMADENAVVGTDGLVKDLHTPTHPRGFASFPKAIRYFVREKKLFTLEEMIRKMTSLPAERFGLRGKGAILDGYDADLLLIDPDRIADRADYTNGSALCDGIERVMVGGVTVYRDQQLTGATPGRFIPHNL